MFKLVRLDAPPHEQLLNQLNFSIRNPPNNSSDISLSILLSGPSLYSEKIGSHPYLSLIVCFLMRDSYQSYTLMWLCCETQTEYLKPGPESNPGQLYSSVSC